MKAIIVLFLLFSYTISLAQTKEEIVFLDGCKNFEQIDSIMFSSINGKALEGNIKNSDLITEGINHIDGYLTDGLNFNIWFYSDESFDTLEVPRLRIEYYGGMHNMKLRYTDCGEVLNSKFEESWRDGKTKFRGEFKSGFPIIFEQFNRNGQLILRNEYSLSNFDLLKSEYYNGEGALLWFMVYGRKKIKVYDFDGKRLRRKDLEAFFSEIEWRPTIPVYSGASIRAYD